MTTSLPQSAFERWGSQYVILESWCCVTIWRAYIERSSLRIWGNFWAKMLRREPRWFFSGLVNLVEAAIIIPRSEETTEGCPVWERRRCMSSVHGGRWRHTPNQPGLRSGTSGFTAWQRKCIAPERRFFEQMELVVVYCVWWVRSVTSVRKLLVDPSYSSTFWHQNIIEPRLSGTFSSYAQIKTHKRLKRTLFNQD